MSTLNRRSFLRNSLAGSAAAAVLPSAALAHTPAIKAVAVEPLRTSIMSYSFHGLLREGMIDVFGYLETARHRYGMRAADLWSGLVPNIDEAWLAKVRTAIDERELIVADLAVDGAHVWEDDADTREEHYRNALAYLNAARILGARFVRIDAGGEGDTWTDEQFDHIVQRFKEYAQYAQDNGFTVGAENHWGPEKVWSNLKRLYEAVDHPAFGISCHIGSWTGTEEEQRTADREVAPWVSHTHIDWNTCTGPLLEEKLGNLWRAGYDGYYSVEHHSAEDEYANVAIQLALVREKLEDFRDGGMPGPAMSNE